jgi:uncharacterized protein
MFNKNLFKKVFFNTTAISIITFSTNAFSVSFDCSKATQRSEKMVCASPLLSSLDDQMFALYTKAKSTQNPEALKQAQIDWIKQVRQCDSEKCVENLYIKRISDLQPQNTITSALGAITSSAPNQIVTQESKPTENQQPTTSEATQQPTENRQGSLPEATEKDVKESGSDNSILPTIFGFILTLLVIAIPFIGGRRKKK